MQIRPEYLTFGRLAANRLFVIPKYQRAYSWTSKQRRDLFADIDKVDMKGQASSHFMATVVGLRRGDPSLVGTDEFVHIEIVDGQQRLTTLTVLLKAISKALEGSSLTAEQKAQGEVEALLVKDDDVNLLLLQTNHDTSQIFTDYIRHGTMPQAALLLTEPDHNTAAAIAECEDFVARWKLNSKVLHLYSLIKNRLTFIFHEVGDEALVYSVFEVLNSRGLDVVWFDKLKSLLMSILFENAQQQTAKTAIAELHSLWGDIYQTIGLRRGLSSETLRFCGTLRSDNEPSKTVSEEAAVDQLTHATNKLAPKVIETTKLILQTVQAEKRLSDDVRLSAATRTVQARLVAVAIILQKLSGSDESRCLRAWEKVTFKIFGLADRDSRSKVGDYVRLAWKISNKNLKAQEIISALETLGADYPIKTVVTSLRGRNCYRDWTEELRYLLYRYEEHIAAKHGQKINDSQWNKIWATEPANSIEHIQPQSKSNPVVKSSKIFAHRLGNLTLLPPGLNSSLKDKDPKLKAERYLISGLMDTMSVGKNIADGWNLAAIEAREKQILDWVETEWG